MNHYDQMPQSQQPKNSATNNSFYQRKGNLKMNKITVNGIEYVQADQVQTAPTGTRAVVVVDRGWIFAGDVTRENGRIKLDRAVMVFRWDSIGFDGVIADPKSSKVTLKPMNKPVDIPDGSEIFCVPVDANWGL